MFRGCHTRGSTNGLRKRPVRPREKPGKMQAETTGEVTDTARSHWELGRPAESFPRINIT